MNLTTYNRATDFLAVVKADLLRYEVTNYLLISISQRVADVEAEGGANPWGDVPPYFASISEGDTLIGAAAMTPPYNLILSLEMPPDAMMMLMGELREKHIPVPGVIGPKAEAEAFAALWCKATGQIEAIGMRQRVYKLTSVNDDLPVASGKMRFATEDDADTIIKWYGAFLAEAVPSDPASHVEESARARIAAGDIFVWEDGGKVVTMSAKARPTGNGITVNLVYTPPEHRRKGYATTLVAQQSQYLLDSGYGYCTLFTDLDFPTSNAIYMKIGYEPICDFMMLKFGDDV